MGRVKKCEKQTPKSLITPLGRKTDLIPRAEPRGLKSRRARSVRVSPEHGKASVIFSWL